MQPKTNYFKRSGLVLGTLAVALVPLIIFFVTGATPHVTPIEAAAAPPHDWVIVMGTTGTVSLVDAATDIVYGPVLSGQLGTSGGGLFDVAVSPDGRTALISNFGDSAVFFVDISTPLTPSVITSVTLPFFAEDIAISQDGRYALVTDGGFSPMLAQINMISRTLDYTVELGLGRYANAVDIAPNGTAVVIDYFGGPLHALYPDGSGHYTVTHSYSYTLAPDGHITATYGAPPYVAGHSRNAVPGKSTADLATSPNAVAADYFPRPVNVAVAPDGQTVLVADVTAYDVPTETLYSVGVYRITAPGVLTLTGVITELTRATQSIAFNPNGTKAYLNQNGGDTGTFPFAYNHMAVLDILGPGLVKLNLDDAAEYPRLTGSQLFGVDTIAVVNGKAYVSYPTISGATNDLRVVNLTDYSVRKLTMPGISTGIAAIPVRKVYLPLTALDFP